MNGSSSAELLALCDQLRDVELVDLGVAIDDQEGTLFSLRNLIAGQLISHHRFVDGQALVKLVAPQVLRKAREEKLALAAEKLARKADAKAAEEKKRLERLEKGRQAPSDMFRTADYSAWDEAGIPTLDKEGVEVAKSKLKKLKKDYDLQSKLHTAFKEWQAEC